MRLAEYCLSFHCHSQRSFSYDLRCVYICLQIFASERRLQILIKLFLQLAAEVDQELNVIHKFVRDKYEKRFPELESLVPNALEYLATVKLLGNDISTKGQNKQILRFAIFFVEIVFCNKQSNLIPNFFSFFQPCISRACYQFQ